MTTFTLDELKQDLLCENAKFDLHISDAKKRLESARFAVEDIGIVTVNKNKLKFHIVDDLLAP